MHHGSSFDSFSPLPDESEWHESLLSAALSAGGLGTWVYEIATDLFTFTPEFYRALRTSSTAQGGFQMSSRAYAERFVAPEARGIVGTEIAGALTSKDPRFQRTLTHPVVFGDGVRGHVRVSFTMIRDSVGKPTHLVGVNQDVTGQVEQLEELSEQREELEALNEELAEEKARAQAASEAKSAFLATMSHELRTPMSGILGMTELLLGMGLNEEQQEAALTAQRSGHILLDLLNDLLDLSKIDAGGIDLEEVEFDIVELVSAACELFRGQIEPDRVELSLSVRNGFSPVRVGDSTRVRQVVVNLLSNAVKFTAHGSIDVSLD